jgi:ABC-type Mn2+/Zn2+ transport system ATPase subunit
MAILTPERNHTHAATSASRTEPLLLVRDLTVTYQGEPAIRDVGFDVQPGERVAIIGPNGAGKSTLIQALLGLLQPQSGEVRLQGIDFKQIGYVPQNEGVDWSFPVTVADVVMLGRTRHIGWFRWPARAQWQAVDAALDRVGMLAFRDRQVGELSGGQRRRVFIARALAQEARLLVLDEPFSGVDVQAQNSLMDVLDDLNAAGMTMLLSTHDLNLAFSRFDRVLALRGGVVAYGKPAEVYTPEVLEAMYGGRLAIVRDGHSIDVYVDDHACTDC